MKKANFSAVVFSKSGCALKSCIFLWARFLKFPIIYRLMTSIERKLVPPKVTIFVQYSELN